MFTKVKTATLEGVEGSLVTVETDIRRGMPNFTIVGLADTTIKEACSRIKPAILNSGYDFPQDRVTVNLAPADRPKEGTHFDIPIAVGLLGAMCGFAVPEDTAFLGELSLDGTINGIKGALPLALCMRRYGIRKVVLPACNAQEVSILRDVEVMPVETLMQIADYISGRRTLPVYKGKKIDGKDRWDIDYSQVIGQEAVKRAVVIGVAGNHGMLLMGGPGCGKTMIARRIPTIMPELEYEEMLEITGVYSVAGLLSEKEPIVNKRPFRSPHHTITAAGLLGGGGRPRPGEISLAHRGVLFLDELGEFGLGVIDAMRQPVEDGVVRLIRNNREVRFPSRVMMVAAANPCKCGHLWDEKRICSCNAHQLEQYERKLNGPFSDRIDMHIRMHPVERAVIENETHRQKTICSGEMRRQVKGAVAIQRKRYAGRKYNSNGNLDEKGIEEFCPLDSGCREVMAAAYDKLGLSMRAFNRIVKVARTIADLGGSKDITREHITEALMYRIHDGDTGRKERYT